MSEGDDHTEDLPAPTKREGRGAVRTAPVQTTTTGRLTRGTSVDRYLVLDVLGAGGMGVVYSAFDPELGRKVALKLLDAEPTDDGTAPLDAARAGDEQARLLREARALAQLSHPNVVAVYDVGLARGDQVFVAMELVDGVNLREWFRGAKRTWRDVVPVLRAAGEGLGAAHAAGLVHRDFKPENVLVGNDGRVRVMDFGLARHHAETGAERPLGDVRLRAHIDPITNLSTLLGTPPYMAPELFAGADASARSDQFAFGVTLYEGLFGERPYTHGEGKPEFAPAKAPDGHGVPQRVVDVAMRAIAIEPDARFASMTDVLRELAIDPHRTRRRALFAIAALAIGGAAVGFYGMRGGERRCTNTERRLAGVWDTEIAARARAAFLASGKPNAPQSFTGVQRELDAYSTKWVTAARENCKATRVYEEQTEADMALRDHCLEKRLAELRAFTRLVAGAEGALVDKGDKAVFELQPLEQCDNLAALRQPGLPPAAKAKDVAALETQLADAAAQIIAGKSLDAMVTTQKVSDAAIALAWDPLVAQALMFRGTALLAGGNFADATRAFTDSTLAAVRGRLDDGAAFAALSAALVIADQLGDGGKALVWLDVGIAIAARVDLGPAFELKRYEVEGVVRTSAGDVVRGIAAHEKALALAQQLHGNDSPALWQFEAHLATTYSRAAAHGKAVPLLERALRRREASAGGNSLEIATLLSNLGNGYERTHDFARARAVLERSIAIRMKLFDGLDTPLLLAPLDNLGVLATSEGKPAEAIPIFERGLQAAAMVPGPTHPAYHQIATDYAEALTAARRFADARAAYDRVLALEAEHRSPLLPHTQSSRAELALAEGAHADAATWAERAITGFERAAGADNPLLWLPLTRLAEAKLAVGDHAAARGHVERAIALGERFYVTPVQLARSRAVLANLAGK